MKDVLYPLHTFKEQLSFMPHIENADVLTGKKTVIICGMGGSAISVSLLKIFFPELRVALHNSYGLPVGFDAKNTLLILNSYSGDTEETLDAFRAAISAKAEIAVLTKGGRLLEEAKKLSAPHIVLPSIDIEPRFSIGHQLLGLLTLMEEEAKCTKLREQATLFNNEHAERSGKRLAELFSKKNIVIYSSANLLPITYLIKAAINEGAKTPCFVNIIPEANHNELQSYVTSDSQNSAETFGFLMLSSPFDHVRITRRLSVMESVYNDRGFTVTSATIDHTSISDMFELIITGYYFATHIAINKNVDPYTTPLIQEFKKKIL
jgi:glucose/mannose-6-phosphate isomerase